MSAFITVWLLGFSNPQPILPFVLKQHEAPRRYAFSGGRARHRDMGFQGKIFLFSQNFNFYFPLLHLLLDSARFIS